MPTLHEPIHAPEFQIGDWINSTPLTMSALRGRILLIDFWDYTCNNCLRTLPYLKEWWHRYRDHRFTLIGVHAPEFSFAKEPVYIREAIDFLEIDYPILLDGELRTWQVWANRYWPTKYLVDARGYIRFFHYGEGQYNDTELAIQNLLHEVEPDAEFPAPMPPLRASDMPGASCFRATPEQYLGYRRGRIANTEGYAPNQVVTYTHLASEREDIVSLSGEWYNDMECVVLANWEGSIYLRYHAKEVNIVATPPGNKVGILVVEQDGLPIPKESFGKDVHEEENRCIVSVDVPRMYNIVSNTDFGTHALHLHVHTPGLALYTLTFTTECRSEELRKRPAA
ncbi:MAG TPA: redoxin domain-containing protein [Armatimonadota bacterium]|nr:redoxin domain-containing protein [Armatimonadota bacterium]